MVKFNNVLIHSNKKKTRLTEGERERERSKLSYHANSFLPGNVSNFVF